LKRRVGALILTVAVAAVAGSSCGGNNSAAAVAKAGSRTVTTAQLAAVLAIGRSQYRSRGIPFPRPGTAEYVLLRQQALAYLVERTQAAQADADLGFKPAALLATTQSFAKVTASVRVTGGNTDALAHRRRAAMTRWLADVRRRFPISYTTGYAPLSAVALARKVSGAPAKTPCDLPVGQYTYAKARDHNCLGGTPIPGIDGSACTLIELPTGAPSGFTSAEENSGFALYVEDVAGSCSPDPRGRRYPVTLDDIAPSLPPVPLSYLDAKGLASFTDRNFDWTLRYPRRLHVRRIHNCCFTMVSGVEIANFSLHGYAPNRPVAPGAVDFTFTQASGGLGVVPRQPSAHDSTFPLSLDEFSASGETRILDVQAGGIQFGATVRMGGAVSAADLAALKAVIASIRFPALRIHTFTPGGYYVLGPAASFRLGSVTRVAGVRRGTQRVSPSFLVHTRDGLWEVTPSNNVSLAHGYKSCGVRFDAARRRFFCSNGAVWDLAGDVIVNPNPKLHPDDPLQRQTAPVSYDGHVLVY
jgi:hypothetical protein